jgi:hypothetical protein
MAFGYLDFNDKSLAQRFTRQPPGTVMVQAMHLLCSEWCGATGAPPNPGFSPLIYID